MSDRAANTKMSQIEPPGSRELESQSLARPVGECSIHDLSAASISKGPQAQNFGVGGERQVLDFWARAQIFDKVRDKNKGGPFYRFIDGPITANNPMGVHHAYARALKDIILRYRALRGYDTSYQPGFDCQGLWVEVQVEKALQLQDKRDIERLGLAQFSRACRERVEKFSRIQIEQSKRLGQWMDWDNAYYTHSDRNIEGIWKFLAACNERGWLYKGQRPLQWCTRCGTGLSEHEMSGSVREVKQQSVIVRASSKTLGADLLVWTTTPWTLAANTALAVNPELTYLKIRIEGETTPFIIGKETIQRSEAVKGEHAANGSELGAKLAQKKFAIISELTGSELIGHEYESLVNLRSHREGSLKIVPWTEVSPEEGTGIVHIAPGCGPEDYKLGKEQGLEVIVPIDDRGDYVAGFDWLSGKSAKEVGPDVITHLEEQKKLFNSFEYEHTVGVCWRCKEEAVFRLSEEWFIATDQIRQDLISAAQEVEWQPEHLKKRMTDWLSNMGDWCISRRRFWGLPLPIYECGDCDKTTVVSSKAELRGLAKEPQQVDNLPELHRPWIDEVALTCPCCVGGKIKRVEAVGDCWLDAGITPFTTDGCFASPKDGTTWGPAEKLSEMSEQVQLWFYSLLMMGVTLTGQSPYKRIQSFEAVVAEDGKKFSKTGSMIPFDEAVETIGADAMRYLFARSSQMSPIRFGYNLAAQAQRTLDTLWNTAQFMALYAKIDRVELQGDFQRASLSDPTDLWLCARLDQFCAKADTAYEHSDNQTVIREFELVVDDISNWYVRLNRSRFWKSENDHDKMCAFATLHDALRRTAIVMAPIVPFLTEGIWQEKLRPFMKSLPESVHLADFPISAEQQSAEAPILHQMDSVRQVVNLARNIRSQENLPVRQVLAELKVSGAPEVLAACRAMSGLIEKEVNVKKLTVSESLSELLVQKIRLDFAKAGRSLGPAMPEVKAILLNLPENSAVDIVRQIENGAKQISLPGWTGLNAEKHAGRISTEWLQIKEEKRSETVATAARNGINVGLDINVTPELKREGLARHIVRHVQGLRKECGLEVTDRIILAFDTSSDELLEVLAEHSDLITNGTLGAIVQWPLHGQPLGNVSVQLPESGILNIALSKTASH